MAAATAIWKDLRAHRILPALLNVEDTDDEDNPEYDIGAGICSSCTWPRKPPDLFVIRCCCVPAQSVTLHVHLSTCVTPKYL